MDKLCVCHKTDWPSLARAASVEFHNGASWRITRCDSRRIQNAALSAVLRTGPDWTDRIEPILFDDSSALQTRQACQSRRFSKWEISSLSHKSRLSKQTVNRRASWRFGLPGKNWKIRENVQTLGHEDHLSRYNTFDSQITRSILSVSSMAPN